MNHNSNAFLSLEDVAEILAVNYQLIYRLVRDGELPAMKIGRVYRIARKDLDSYLERSKVVQSSGFVCPSCLSVFESKLSIGGYNSQTGEPICLDCWMREKK